jgi:hypothetical protein
MRQEFNSQELVPKTILTIRRTVFSALHPMDQLIVRALERENEVQIIEDSEFA